MRRIEDFSAKERQQASYKLRYVRPHDVAKIEFKPSYWHVPLLIRLIDRVDEFVVDKPEIAVEMAESVVKLASRIPTRQPPERVDKTYYLNASERHDFRVWTMSQLCSAYRASGRYEDSIRFAEMALAGCRQASELVQAEVKRRISVLKTDLGQFDDACAMVDEAIDVFEKREDRERAALSFVSRGNIRNLKFGPGTGSVDYAVALQRAALACSRRAERAIVIAAGNLAIDSARSPMSDAETIHRWISAAIEAMKGRRTNVPKAMVRWAEAIVAYRLGLGRFSVRWLVKVRDKLLELKAIPQGVACVVDLLSIAGDHVDEPEYAVIVQDSLHALQKAVEGSTPEEETATVVKRWSENPSDVELLRRHVRRQQVTRLG